MSSLDPNGPLLSGVTTPTLVIDCAKLDANISRMASAARQAGLALRPHAKTHKSAEIARRQQKGGAIGTACATIFEAEGMAEAGIGHLLITSPVVGRDKVMRLARLHRRSQMIAVVDHPAHLDDILQALTDDDAPLGIMVDLDIGQARTGVVNADDGVALVKRIVTEKRLRFAGLQAYAGHVQHIADGEERRRAAADTGDIVRALTTRLTAEGLFVPIVSGSGTGASAFDLLGGPYNELQVGSYVFMDSDYGRILQPSGARLPYENALFVLATVVSVNRPGQITIDAGTKALAVNGPMPDRLIGVPDGSSYSFSGDEHGAIRLPTGATSPRVGARVLVCATHCDPTVNLHAAYHVVADGAVSLWPIVGRYQLP